jgi:hypothetical protein
MTDTLLDRARVGDRVEIWTGIRVCTGTITKRDAYRVYVVERPGESGYWTSQILRVTEPAR